MINWPKEVKQHLYFPIDNAKTVIFVFIVTFYFLLDQNFLTKFSTKKEQYPSQHELGLTLVD